MTRLKERNSFATSVDNLLSEAGTSYGIDLSGREDTLNRYKKFLSRYIENGAKFNRVSSLLDIIVSFYPVFAILLAFVNTKYQLSTKLFVFAWVGYVFIYLLLLLFKSLLPKDEKANILEAKVFKMENVAHRLSAQVSLYNSIQEITHDDDEDIISRFTKEVSDGVNDLAKEDKLRIVKVCSSKHNCADFKETQVTINMDKVPQKVLDELSFVAERVNEACSIIFGKGGFESKIYIRSRHDIDSEGKAIEAELLTAMARFPQSKSSKFGKSWVNSSRGEKARVWDCINTEKKTFVMQNEGKGGGSGVHPSILYLALPAGIGVLTISSDRIDTFIDSNGTLGISDDLEQTLMNATKTLLSRI